MAHPQYPVITLTYENRRTGTYRVIIAPGVTVQSETGDIPLEDVAAKARITFKMRERLTSDRDSLYRTLEDVCTNPNIRSKPELWRIIVLSDDDLETVSDLCTSENVEVAEMTLREIGQRAKQVYDGSLEPVRNVVKK